MKNKILVPVSVIFFILLAFTLFYSEKQRIDWSYSFNGTSKKPFGSYIVFSLMKYYFPGRQVDISHESAYYTLSGKSHTGRAYIFLTNSMNLDEYDASELLEFAKNGNTVFIGGVVNNDFFLENFGVSYKFSLSAKEEKIVFDDLLSYSVTSGTLGYSLELTEVSDGRIIAENSEGRPVFVKFAWGKGTVFLLSMPELLTNYEFSSSADGEYAARIFSNIANADVIWDEYYKPGNFQSGDYLHYVKNNSALKRIYYLLLLVIFLFAVFRTRREQRVIPVITRHENRILTFLHQSGSLLFRKGNNRKIALKKIEYFSYYIEKHFGIPADWYLGSPQSMMEFSGKTGFSPDETEKLSGAVNRVLSRTSVSNSQLSDLDRYITKFKRNFHGVKDGEKSESDK